MKIKINNSEFFLDSRSDDCYFEDNPLIALAKSGIKIKEKNKGKFTEYCGGKVTDECIARAKNSNNPALRKRAVFAENARAWKHQQGGIFLTSNVPSLNLSLLFIDYDATPPETEHTEIEAPEFIELPEPLISSKKKEETEDVKEENTPAWFTNPYVSTTDKPSTSKSTDKPSTSKFSGNQNDFIKMAYNTYKGLGLSDNQALVAASQDALESGWGKHISGRNNYGGIKDFKNGTMRKTREHINGKDVEVDQPFANYDSYEDYAKAKVALLSNKRYNTFIDDNINSMIARITNGGYATDPNYANTLKNIITLSQKKLVS